MSNHKTKRRIMAGIFSYLAVFEARRRLMTMTMVQIWQMGVAVCQWRVAMRVSMTLCGIPRKIMLVTMMVVMLVEMLMRQGLMGVPMLVMLGQHQPGCQRRQSHGNDQPSRDRLAQQHGKTSPKKWGRAEMSAGTRAAKMPQRQDEQHQAHSVAQRAKDQRRRELLPVGKRLAKEQRERQIEATGHQSLGGSDLHGIGR